MADIERLDRIEAAISRHRCDYLKATWEKRPSDARFHRREVDRLLDLWQLVRAGAVLADLVSDVVHGLDGEP